MITNEAIKDETVFSCVKQKPKTVLVVKESKQNQGSMKQSGRKKKV